jgi:Mg/Co/Ni transporter MgtE
MSIISKIDVSPHISDPIDRLRSASDRRLGKITDETNDVDLIRAFGVLDDSTCFKILQHVNDSRLVRLVVSFDNETIENIFSWRNTEIASRVIESCSKEENAGLFMRIFNGIGKPILNTALGEMSQMLLANLLTRVVTSETITQDKGYRVSQILHCLIASNRLSQIIECMSDVHISAFLSLPIMSNSELNKVISQLDDTRLYPILNLMSDHTLGYMLSQINTVSFVRRLINK